MLAASPADHGNDTQPRRLQPDDVAMDELPLGPVDRAAMMLWSPRCLAQLASNLYAVNFTLRLTT
eukprot:4875965-Lingulodinium_polyedra.AAC.1